MSEVIGLISGVLQLVEAISAAAKRYGAFRNAPKERRMLYEEVEALRPLLYDLRTRIASSVSAEGIQQFKNPLMELEKVVVSVRNKLHPGRQTWIRVVSQRAVWMLWEKGAVMEDLAAIERYKSSITNWLALDIWDVVQEARQNHASAIDDRIRRWLAPHNPMPRQRAILSTRQEGTGEWLLESDEFEDWISSVGKTLCLVGMPGAGKTVLASLVVAYLQDRFKAENVGIAYIYCNHKETEAQTPVNLIASLWRQLSLHRTISDDMKHFYEVHHRENLAPTIDDVFGYLQSIILTYFRVIIVVDAVDECPEDLNIRHTFLGKLRTLGPTVNLLLTARPHVVVQAGFPNSRSVEVRATEHDVRRYIDGQIQSSERLTKHVATRPGLSREIQDAIIKQADGMFLLAKLYIDSLASKVRPRDVLEALKNLPKDLNRTYDEAMRRIDSQNEDDRTLALQALGWISKAVRPLSARELQEALALRPGDTVLDDDGLPDIDIVVSVCAGLVVVDETKVVRLIHHTAQTYFDDRNSPSLKADIQLTIICLTYLSLDVFIKTRATTPAEKKEYMLLDYAARHWAEHARGQPESSIRDTILDFLSSQDRRYFSRQILNTRTFAGDIVPNFVSALWIAACLNLKDIAQYFLESGVSPDGFEDHEGNPLYIASYRGHSEMVLLLLNHGADVNGQGYYGTALQAASGEGHKNIVRLLTERGAEISPSNETGRSMCPSPLQAASNGGHVRIVQFLPSYEGRIELAKALLDLGADINASTGSYRTALTAASYGGNIEMVRLLIGKGAHINAEGGRYFTALRAAAERGHVDVARLLIENGARINAKEDEQSCRTALYEASDHGRIEVVRLLVHKGALSNAEGKKCNRLALYVAAERGRVEIMQLLLDAGMDVDASGGHYGNALQAAAADSAKFAAVQLLLQRGAQVNAEGGHFGHALQAAVAANNSTLDVVKLLISNGARVDAKGGHYGNALQAAARTTEGRDEAAEQTVKLLLAGGVDSNARGGVYGSALKAAAVGRNLAVFKLLLDAGANVFGAGADSGTLVEAVCRWGSLQAVQALVRKGVQIDALGDETGTTALQAASSQGNVDVVSFLLENGADINARGGKFGSAVQAAAQEGQLDAVRLLINKGAIFNCQDVTDGDALQRASRGGHNEVVRFLIDAGANVNARCGYYGCALQAASKKGAMDVVQLLLDAGAEINAQGGWYGSALQAAASGGVETMGIQMIKETRDGAKVERAIMTSRILGDSNTPVVKFLIRQGADVNLQGGYYGTAIQAASSTGDPVALRLLLDAGADVQAEGGHFGSAVRAAEAESHSDIIRLLASAGAQPSNEVKKQGGRANLFRGRKDSYDRDNLDDYSSSKREVYMQFEF
ncbi:ankyrin repeat-containing domain protein [Mycena vitilis]|nr:ankyrin repeat-containing domain protein [Mycena vitilis]